MIKVDNLTFSYNDKKMILNDINFSIKNFNFTSIIGPNGSGKTTLMHNLCRFYKPIKGNIYINDKHLNLYKYNELSRLFTFIPQETIINFPYSVLDVVLMGRIPYKNRFESYSKDDINFVHNILEKLDLLDYSDNYITQLSGGEKQRVFFAKALAQSTKLYFLDEAFSSMDISHQIKCLNILKDKIEKENIMVIAIIHDLNIVDHFSDYIIALEKGKLIAADIRTKIMTTTFLKKLFNVKIIKNKNKGITVIP